MRDLIPVLDNALQTTRNNLTRLLRMPIQTGNSAALLSTRQNLMIHLASLPVPEANVAAAVTGNEELTIRRDFDINSVSGIVVAAEALLAVLSELVCSAVDHDLVVAGLEGDVLAVGVGRGSCERTCMARR